MKSYRTYCLLLVMICMSYGCGGDKNSTPSVDIIANSDEVNSHYADNLSIDILSNDSFTVDTKIVIDEFPLYGGISIIDNQIIYSAHKAMRIEDEFSYYLSRGNVKSPPAIVSIILNNSVNEISLPEVDFLEEGLSYQINISMAFPLSYDETLVIERHIDGIQDTGFTPQKIELKKGDVAKTISYLHEVNELAGNYEQEHTLVVFIEDTPEAKSEKTYLSIGIPNPSLMNASIKNIWYNEKDYKHIVDNRAFKLSWMNYPAWTIPLSPSWDEDPYNNNSWLLYYHTLAWLFSYEYAYDKTGDDKYLDIIGDTLLNYLSMSPKDAPKSPLSWYDHTVALRTDTLSYFYNKYFKYRWGELDKDLFIVSIEAHAQELRELLDDQRYYANNHALFHSISLYNYSFAFPVQSGSFDYRVKSKQRINELFGEMVDEISGVSTEQSTGYHIEAIRLFATSNDLIGNLSGEYDEGLREKISKMVDFSAHLLYPNGGAPTMGDANNGDVTYLKKLNAAIENKGIYSTYLDFVISDGESGEALKDVYSSKSSGYALIRPEVNDKWYESSILFFDAGKKRHSHGHHDALNFTLFNGHESLIVDAGGPFVYGKEAEYYRSKYAHNVLIIDGEKEDINDAVLHEAECRIQFCYAIGQIVQRGIIHSRIVLITRDETPLTYIFDHVKSESSHAYELLYHFPSDSKITDNVNYDSITLGSGKSVQLAVISNSLMSKKYYKGNGTLDDDDKRGWVTPKYALEIPSPEIEYTGAGRDYWSLTEIKQNTADSQIQIIKGSNTDVYSLTATGLALAIDLTDINKPVVLALP